MRKKSKIAVITSALFLGLVSISVNAGVELLLKSSESWDGGSFAYPKGKAEISSVKLSLEEGKDAPFHCHPIPTMGYISKGEVLLETEDGKSKAYKEGESVIEVMKTVHRGKATKGDVEIIVFYAGAEGIPLTVFPKDKKAFKKYCKK
jgi:quercetin dioxygenase-like cupin family protein